MPTSIRSTLRRGLHPVLLLVLSAAFFAAHNHAAAQSMSAPDPSTSFAIHSTVSEVRLIFFASDEQNHPLEELENDDFAVVDDERVIRDFLSFTPSAPLGLDVIILIDTSESVRPLFRKEVAAASQLISQWPSGGADNLSVLSFSGTQVQLVCNGYCLRDFTEEHIAALPMGGETPLFDALDVAANSLIQRKRPEVWPVIILFSDGDDTISRTSYHDVSQKIFAAGVQVYAIDIGPRKTSSGTITLQTIAEGSSGRYWRILDGTGRVFSDLMDDLHSARMVTYVPPESGANFHSLQILPTHNLNLRFRCRRGYYLQSDSAR